MGKSKESDDAASQSSAGSGSSVGSKASQSGEQLNKEQQAEGDRNEVLDSNQELTSGVFGVLHATLNSVKYDYLLRFTVARVILDFVQLLLLVLRPVYGFEINEHLWTWQAIKWVEFANPLTSSDYSFYITWIYVGVAIMAGSFGVAIWVGWCNTRHNFPVVWPVMLLRLVLNTSVYLFYISCFSVFLAAFNCNWFMEGQAEIRTDAGTTEIVDLRFRLHRFPQVECLEVPHLAHGIVAFVACVVFTCVAYAVTLTDFEANPTSRRYLATPHSSTELWALTLKTIMALNMAIFAGQLYVQSVIMCLATLALCYLYIRWQPHLNEWVNHIRSGLYCMLFWVSVFMAIMKFDHRRDDPGYLKWLTDAMLIGLGPVLCFGALVSFFRLRLLHWHALRAIRIVPPGVEPADLRNIYRFNDPKEVEIVSRVLRRWTKDDDEVLDPEAVRLADLTIRIGMALFPDNPYIIIVYSNFLISVQDNYPLGTSQLQHVKNMEESSLPDQIIVYCREQENEERGKSMNNSGGESTLDLVAYVQFQKTFRILARANRDALIAIRDFWQILLHHDVPFSKLSAALSNIEKATKRADKTYKVLLDRYPHSARVYRGYARFLEHVKSDPWTAHKYASAADAIEEEEAGTGSATLMMRDDSASMLESVNEKTSAVIVINAEGLIKVASRLAQKLLGYKKSELEGKNVSMIMPPPFSHRHNGYLRTHISSGKRRILDTVREVVTLHKDHYVFPVQLAVTKVSGVGSDSIFMGVMRRYEVEPGVIRVWIMPSGTVISVDDRFMDSFGKSYQDVAGRPFPSLTADADTIIKLLDKAQYASVEDFKQGKIAAKGVSVLHQYMDPVMVDIDVDLGGSVSQRLLALNLRPKEAAGKLMVLDTKGRLLYLNNEMRAMLGYSTAALNKMDLSQIMPLPCALLHANWMREASAKKPKQSCRSSATVVIIDASGQSIFVKPTIVTREVEDTVQHVVHVHPSTREQGLDERRLVLTLDTQGTVLKTSNAHSSLFGFRPSLLIGQSVSSIVDVLGELHTELESVLSKMAQKVIAKPGYSWRVGVHPPDFQDFNKLGPMERQGRIRSTQPALMQFELMERDGCEIPEIKMLLYKADMMSAVIESDAHGIIVCPLVNLLNPSGLIFGCSERSMTRRPLRNYIQMPTKHPDTLVQDDKAKKGAMKSGTTGCKVGPLKITGGFHADGAPQELKVVAISTKNGHVFAKASFNVLEKGDTKRFLRTLVTQEGSKSRRASLNPATSQLEAFSSQELVAGVEQGIALAGTGAAVPDLAAGKSKASNSGAAPKRVMFAASASDEEADAPVPEDSSSSDEEEKEDEESESGQEAELAAAGDADTEGSNSEADADDTTQKLEALDHTDWARGHRLKKLHALLHTRQSRIDFMHFTEQMWWLFAALLGVHLALFVAFLTVTSELTKTVEILDANGRLIVDSQSITISARKISNLYSNKTNPNVYEMTPTELELSLEYLNQTVNGAEKRQHGIYLGFGGLRRLQNVYNLREIWGGSNLEAETYVDTRMPRVYEEGTNLWTLGNTFIDSAQEILLNHERIAEQTNNNFSLNRQWRFIIDNGPDVLAQAYTSSLNDMLKKDLLEIGTTRQVGIAFLVVELAVVFACIVWCWLLLKGLQNSRHKLMAVFFTIPSGFIKVLALRQMQIADQEEGAGVEEEEDDEEAAALMQGNAQQGGAAQSGPNASGPVAKANDLKVLPPVVPQEKGKAFVVDALVEGQQAAGLLSSSKDNLATMLRNKLVALLSEKPIMVGKRKLIPFRQDSFIMLAPLIIWFILVLIVNSLSINTNFKLSRPLIDNYLSARMMAYTARVVADALGVASQNTLAEVADYKIGMDTRLESLRHMYKGLLYGLAPGNRGNLSFIPVDGTLFDDASTQAIFFSYSKCEVKWRPEKYCFDNPDSRFYLVTHNGMDPMVLRLIDDVAIIIAQSDSVILSEGLGSPQIDYIWNVAWHALSGRQQDMLDFYSQQAYHMFSQAQVPIVVLFALSWVLAAAYFVFLFNPFKAKLNHETRQIGELLSQLPSDMNMERSVAVAAGVDDQNELFIQSKDQKNGISKK